MTHSGISYRRVLAAGTICTFLYILGCQQSAEPAPGCSSDTDCASDIVVSPNVRIQFRLLDELGKPEQERPISSATVWFSDAAHNQIGHRYGVEIDEQSRGVIDEPVPTNAMFLEASWEYKDGDRARSFTELPSYVLIPVAK